MSCHRTHGTSTATSRIADGRTVPSAPTRSHRCKASDENSSSLADDEDDKDIEKDGV